MSMTVAAVGTLASGIDILEDNVYRLDAALLQILLLDRTTGKNILWATTDYEQLGSGYGEFEEITVEAITGFNGNVIQPRVEKSKSAQSDRTRERAEVFTPSWVCNAQNNLIDTEWFGRKNIFNIENGTRWTATLTPIPFAETGKDWRQYVDDPRLEITCGEAPYLVSRYDTVSGKLIPLRERTGLLDRKLRVVNENTQSEADWLKWSQRAFESIYGFEYQGDNLLLARENLLYAFAEYYRDRFGRLPELADLRKTATIISWNLWQMDGLKGVVPGSCIRNRNAQVSWFGAPLPGAADETCPGCRKGGLRDHIGQYCRIKDWRGKTALPWVSMVEGGMFVGADNL